MARSAAYARSRARVVGICDRVGDARALRQQVLKEISQVVSFDAYAWLLTDPETSVGAAPLANVPSPLLPLLPRLIRLKYLTEVNRWTMLGSSAASLRETTGGELSRSRLWRELLDGNGVVDVASCVFRDRFGCWGFLDLWRTGAGTHFTDAQTAHLSSIIEAVTTALRRCQANTFLVRPMREPRRLGPVVLLLSPELQVLGQTPETHEYLRVLVPPVDRRAPISASAYNVAAQLLAVEAEVDRNPPSARVHLSEGLWVSLRAARIGDAEPSPWHLTLITQPCAPPRRHRCHRPLRHEITKSGCRTNVGGVQGHPSVPSLIAECRRPGLPGIVPSARFSLAAVPELVLAELARCRRGVVVLGVDGLSHAAAARCWPSAELTCLTSTFPSTSATAWLTALTGCGPRVHGVPGMVYRVGATMVYAVTGEGIAGEPVVPAGAVVPQPTVFERAGAAGARCLALGRELVHLPGTWAPALLRGTTRAAAARTPGGPAAVAWTSAELAAQAADPGSLVDAVAAEVTAVLAGTGGSADGAPTLLWVYVNADDYVHATGYDRRLLAALRRLDGAAREWAAGGWTVAAHSDHGQVPVRSDPALAQAWARVDDPRECELPGGGAGRVRWLHPRPGREDEVRARLADALGDAAVVLAARDLDLPPGLRLPLDRVGAVVAIAASERFPLPNPELRYEHGGLDVEEMLIPLATWRSR